MTRLTPEHRRRLLLDAALEVAHRDGLYNMTKSSIARQAECSQPLITHYFGSDIQMRAELLKHSVDIWTNDRACDQCVTDILAQAIVMRDPAVDCLSEVSRSEILIDSTQNSV